MTKLRWLFMYSMSLLAARVGRYLPTTLVYAVSGPIADLGFRLMTRHRENLVANLARVVGPELAPATARRVFRNFTRYIIDFYQLPLLGRDALWSRLAFNDWRHLNEALDAPKGTLFVTLHLGQIDLGAAAVAAHGHAVNVVAEALPDARLDGFIQDLRRQLNVKVIPAMKSKLDVLRCLSRGEVLVMMVDTVEPGQGVPVQFFGAETEMAAHPARIALRTGARLLPAVIGRGPDGKQLVPVVDFDLRFEPSGDEEADVRALTQQVAHSLEGFVRRFPDQWFAFRPVWPGTQDQGPGTRASNKQQATSNKDGTKDHRPGTKRSDTMPWVSTHGTTRNSQQRPGRNGKSTKPVQQVERWKQWSLLAAVKLGARLPRSFAYGLARLAGDAAFHLRAPTRANVEDNMRHVMGAGASREAVRTAARDAFRNVARYYVDLIRLPQTRPAKLLEDVRLYGLDKLKGRLDAGQGVIVATAHFGNPELAVQVGALLGLKIFVLAEPLRPPSFARIMKGLRSTHGPRYEDVGFSGVAEAIRHLRKGGGCLAITCDRDIQGNGATLPFFGVKTNMPLGPVDLAVRTGSVLMPGYCRRVGDGFEVTFEDPIELASTGDRHADELVNASALLGRAEAWIRSDPGQWMVLERIWKVTSNKHQAPSTKVEG